MERSAASSAPSRVEAQTLADGIRKLEQVVERELWSADSAAHAAMLYKLPNYAELLEYAYASGFVRGNLSHEGFDFDEINAKPLERLGCLPYTEACRYLHALYRAERWNHGWGSPVLAAIQSGALGVVAARLEAGQ